MRIRKLAAVGAALTATLVFAGPAQAGTATVYGCKSGEVCVYKNGNSGPSFSTYGDWAPTSSSKYVTGNVIFNNGKRYPGFDHIRWEGHMGSDKYKGCLHYEETTTGMTHGSSVYSGSAITFTKMIWGKECGATEYGMQRR
ncbi:hypothetical protein [Streptomyces alkaliterrae]|uniref:Peptidase inhibitor family I36 n=1 Tax=Streptomyces alkaliterrae TaxID=2213162 RepID=A0A5P0YNZ4_9ACTN|nr:hypothetical protein [Streptomyces alkaliterrae]MBB1257968.1 hypothetical protein [Streptomyces alkaliterrae]MQS01152.1 hypothetical protein [Streptomyces alkaliterrae]